LAGGDDLGHGVPQSGYATQPRVAQLPWDDRQIDSCILKGLRHRDTEDVTLRGKADVFEFTQGSCATLG
jgi:hypothetical protein